MILIQCALSILKFTLLHPYDEDSYEGIAYDLFYDRPKHLTKEEKRFILAVFIITSIGIYRKKSVNIFNYHFFNQLTNHLFINWLCTYSDSLFLVYNIFIVSAYAVL